MRNPCGKATVIGGGVIGLTTAITAQEAGFEVRLLSPLPPEATVSAVAAAVWYPYKALPEAKVASWGARSYGVFAGAAGLPETGVQMRTGLDLVRPEAPEPWWRDALPSIEACPPEELPPGYEAAWRFEVPVIEMPVYLRWLQGRFEAEGGRIETRRVDSLSEVAQEGPVFNCTGLGARDLVGDLDVRPVKGQVVLVRNPGLTRFLLDEEHPEGVTYVIPRSNDCVLGGSAEEDVWDEEPSPELARSIMKRCIDLEPRLEGAQVIGQKAGLRPVRTEVRLEAERLPEGPACIHNYGHGGAGVTLSWGCAEEAVDLARAL